MQPFHGIGDKGAEMMKLSGILLIVICLLLAPAGAWAQGTGAASIAGVVHDASGAVLPGVVIEATSPALIEKFRSAVTDGRGLYLIADLRPGKYDVTFTIPGFSTVKREGIELTVGFTATVNADLAVGTLEETITVSGGAPIVDTRTVIQRTTFSGSGGYIWGSHHLQQSNLTDALRARGLTATPSLKQFFDAGFGIGGPIKKDKLWFHVAVRDWKTARYFAGNYYNLTPHTLLYTPDPSRPGYSTDFYRNLNLRLTGQASAKDRVTGHLTYDNNCDCDIRGSGTIEPSANINHYYRPMARAVFTWSRPQTNRLLYEAGAAAGMSTLDPQRAASAGGTENDIGVVDTRLGITYGSTCRVAPTFPTPHFCYGG